MFGDDSYRRYYETRDISRDVLHMPSFVGRRIEALREEFGWSQAMVGVATGLELFGSKTVGSICKLVLHKPRLSTSRLIATAFDLLLTYRYCEDDNISSLLLSCREWDRQFEIVEAITSLGRSVPSNR